MPKKKISKVIVKFKEAIVKFNTLNYNTREITRFKLKLSYTNESSDVTTGFTRLSSDNQRQ